MDCNKTWINKDDAGDACLTADCENSESEKDKGRCSSEDLTSNASWSQRSLSRSLQRAEILLRSTFNPNLKWLIHGRSQDEDMEEGNFLEAPNLVSWSSVRLLHLQHALLTVAPQYHQVGGSQGYYGALWKLLEERSLLLFTHEYIRRVSVTKTFISRLRQLLERHMNKSHPNQVLSSLSSGQVSLGSLSQELRVHLNHWSCLFSKVQSDSYLRHVLVQKSWLLVDIKQTLDMLSLQAMILMQQYLHVILCATAQADLNTVLPKVLVDIVAGIDVYNQAVEKQRAQRCTTQLRTAVLQQALYNTIDSSLPTRKSHLPAAFSVKELTMILAAHHAERAAEKLHCWMSKQSFQLCLFHNIQKTSKSFNKSLNSGLSSALRPERTYESQCQTNICQSVVTHSCKEALHSVYSNLERLTGSENHKLLNPFSFFLTTSQNCAPLPLSDVCQQDHYSAKLFYQALVSSSDLLAPLMSLTPTPEPPSKHRPPITPTNTLLPYENNKSVCSTAPNLRTADPVVVNILSTELTKEQRVDEVQQRCAELEKPTRLKAASSSGYHRNGDPVKEETLGAEGQLMEPECVRGPPSVQWLDLGQSLVYEELLKQYRTLLQTLSSKALWLQLRVPHTGSIVGSINLLNNDRVYQILHQISHALDTDLVPKYCRPILEDLSPYLLGFTAHAQWDYELCTSLGSALRDKCLTDVRQSSYALLSSPMQDERLATSATMEHFLLLTPPLLSSLHCHDSHRKASASFSPISSGLAFQRQTMSLVLATVQLSTVWVMCKAYQFLSSWSLNKFLLITQGDLKVLRECLEVTVHQITSLIHSNDEHHSSLHNHSQLQLRQQLKALDRAVCELQTFSSLVLKIFSSDCKRMSGEIFEQTMPSAVHWRPSNRTGLPMSPSEYASLAAQTVIGQVLESVAPLSEDARVQALSITVTAFMEAWMEHILKQKIKFSVQGALQLKQDFDSVRDMIQSDKYGLSAEIHQRLLSLRVFQQVDSAVVCLLQQPHAKPYLQSRAWNSFVCCCPSNSSSGRVVGSSITNLRCVEGEDLCQAEPSAITTNLYPVDPSTTGEPYLAPSVDLGATQQEWLNLRIHSSARRWRLPGLHGFSKSEP